MANIGKIFEGEIRKFLEREYLLILRPLDIVGSRFMIKKEFDYAICSAEGLFVAIECKATRSERFDFAMIKEHQRENLTVVSNTEHGKAYLALNFREKKRPGQAYLIPWDWWLTFEDRWLKRSIRKPEAQEEFWRFQLTRIVKGWTMPNVHGPRIRLT